MKRPLAVSRIQNLISEFTHIFIFYSFSFPYRFSRSTKFTSNFRSYFDGVEKSSRADAHRWDANMRSSTDQSFNPVLFPFLSCVPSSCPIISGTITTKRRQAETVIPLYNDVDKITSRHRVHIEKIMVLQFHTYILISHLYFYIVFINIMITRKTHFPQKRLSHNGFGKRYTRESFTTN